jgi:aspartyl protease family protein
MKNTGKHRIATSQIILMAIAPAVTILAFSERAAAQNLGTCFMVTATGRTLSLSKLCGVSPPPSIDSRVFRVPIVRRSGKVPIIEVKFNGSQTFEMMLDTGASGTLITQSMANALKIKPTGTVRAQIADGSEVKFLTGMVRSIGVSRAVVNNVEVAIAPKGEIGLLGHDFFGNYDLKILENAIEFHRR